jgi:GAF domain-containing protein
MMEPTSGTKESFQELARDGDDAVAQELANLGRAAREIVPDLVGLSLGIVEDAFTFTLVAESDLARIDAVQYLDDGPCVAAARDGEVISFVVDDQLDEGRWAMFARASAASGVRSSLSIPIIQDGDVVAGINLYASAPEAFVGHHEELAKALGGWSPGAVTNADLAFRTRLDAASTPMRIREQSDVARAVGFLAEIRQVSVAAALVRLQTAAGRAGVTVSEAARVLLAAVAADEAPGEDTAPGRP